MEIGEALRFIRKSKGLTQREMQTEYLDRSAYSRIENKSRAVSLDDLEQILNTLSLSRAEFFSILGQEKQEKFKKLFYSCYTYPKNKKLKKKLLMEYMRLEKKIDKNLREWSNLSAIKSSFSKVWKEIKPMSQTEVEDVSRYLGSNQYFYHHDYILFSNTMQWMRIEQIIAIAQKMFPLEDSSSRDRGTLNAVNNTASNLVTLFIYNKDYEYATKYITLAEKSSVTDYSHRLNMNYLKNLVKLLTTGKPEYYRRILNYTDILDDVGDVEHAKCIREEIKMLVHDKEEVSIDAISVGLFKNE